MKQETQMFSIKFSIKNEQFLIIDHDPNILIHNPAFDKASINNFVRNYLKDLEGAPELGDYQIVNWLYDDKLHEGKFRLKFTINRRYCCSDQSSCRNDYMDFSFRYANQNITASATYFDWTLSS